MNVVIENKDFRYVVENLKAEPRTSHTNKPCFAIPFGNTEYIVYCLPPTKIPASTLPPEDELKEMIKSVIISTLEKQHHEMQDTMKKMNDAADNLPYTPDPDNKKWTKERLEYEVRECVKESNFLKARLSDLMMENGELRKLLQGVVDALDALRGIRDMNVKDCRENIEKAKSFLDKFCDEHKKPEDNK